MIHVLKSGQRWFGFAIAGVVVVGIMIGASISGSTQKAEVPKLPEQCQALEEIRESCKMRDGVWRFGLDRTMLEVRARCIGESYP